MLYMSECKTDGLPRLSLDFLCGNCFLLQTNPQLFVMV